MVQVLFDQGALVRDGAASMAKPLRRSRSRLPCKASWRRVSTSSPPADKDLLQSLAVIGKEFPLGLVRRVVGDIGR